MSNIARDNTIFSTLLAAYIRSQGQDYIKEILAPPLNECLELLEKCEIDPAKLKNLDFNLTDEEANKISQQNCKNLEKCCDVIFDYIFKNQNRLPRAINELCAQLALELQGEEEPGFVARIDTASMQSTSKLVSQLASADSARHSEVNSITDYHQHQRTDSMDKVLEKAHQLQIGSTGSVESENPLALESASSDLHIVKVVKYSIAEKVVGSFLFLRFIVPGNFC